MNSKILIICTGNTCRSQMAEGFLKNIDSGLQVFSAGTKAESIVNPYAVKVMAEKGIDISSVVPEGLEKYLSQDFDYVITVCDGAKQLCPVFTGRVNHRLHIGFEDPADATGNEEEKLLIYRKVRDQIEVAFGDFYKECIVGGNLNTR